MCDEVSLLKYWVFFRVNETTIRLRIPMCCPANYDSLEERLNSLTEELQLLVITGLNESRCKNAYHHISIPKAELYIFLLSIVHTCAVSSGQAHTQSTLTFSEIHFKR